MTYRSFKKIDAAEETNDGKFDVVAVTRIERVTRGL